ncbi:TPA: hypothetical protein JGU28_004580 [Salmonella enterica]|nr:hypothetical protein [Salmonella enterica]
MNAVDIIKNYLSGDVTSEEFQTELYNNKELEVFLSEEIAIPPYTNNSANVFFYLIENDLLSIYGEVNCKDLLAKYLAVKNIKYTFDNGHRERHSMLINIQPAWLRIPDEYLKFLMSKHKDKSSKELERALKKDIASNFRCLNKKPKWLQSPQWPIEGNTPLFFLGQFDISEMRHDTSFVYVFFNREKNTYTEIEQSM